MIPKKIHYCWFGGAPLSSLNKKCIASWKKYFPDYEIIEWNENNFDVNCCTYVKEAYEAKKWAFVSDYARFKILYEHGGLYFDTDVEVIKPFDDLLEKGGFMGRENETKIEVNPGLGLGTEPGLEIYKELLDAYNTRKFILKDGSFNLKTIVEYTTEMLTEYGITNANEIQFAKGIYVYPKEYFCPINRESGKLEITKNTYSIHRYSASWETKENILRGKIYKFLNRFFGKKLADSVRKIFRRKPGRN